MTRTARSLVVPLAVAALALASPARAQETVVAADSAAEARSQYQQGTQAFQAKRYSEAALHFEAAAAVRAHAVTLYTAGLAWDLASKPERAADAYSRALEVPGLDAKQTNVARDRVEKLERTLGTLAVSAPEGWKVQLDTFTEVPTPARLHGTPGPHALSVRAPGKPIERRDVVLEAATRTNLELKEEPKPPPRVDPPATRPVAPPPAPPPPPVVQDSPWSARRAIGFGVAGLGVAALGGGVILGLSANGARDTYNAAPTREGFDHASSLQTWTNVALIGGGVLLAGGIVLIILPKGDSGEVRMGITPRGAALSGSF